LLIATFCAWTVTPVIIATMVNILLIPGFFKLFSYLMMD
jgi:hypothetical protein